MVLQHSERSKAAPLPDARFAEVCADAQIVGPLPAVGAAPPRVPLRFWAVMETNLDTESQAQQSNMVPRGASLPERAVCELTLVLADLVRRPGTQREHAGPRAHGLPLHGPVALLVP